MKAIDFIQTMRLFAEEYVPDANESLQRNKHMNEIFDGEKIQERIIKAVIVDYINYSAAQFGMDYAMQTKDI